MRKLGALAVLATLAACSPSMTDSEINAQATQVTVGIQSSDETQGLPPGIYDPDIAVRVDSSDPDAWKTLSADGPLVEAFIGHAVVDSVIQPGSPRSDPYEAITINRFITPEDAYYVALVPDYRGNPENSILLLADHDSITGQPIIEEPPIVIEAGVGFSVKSDRLGFEIKFQVDGRTIVIDDKGEHVVSEQGETFGVPTRTPEGVVRIDVRNITGSTNLFPESRLGSPSTASSSSNAETTVLSETTMPRGTELINATNLDVQGLADYLNKRYAETEETISESNTRRQGLEVFVAQSVVDTFASRGVDYAEFIVRHAEQMNRLLATSGSDLRVNLPIIVIVEDNVAQEIKEGNGCSIADKGGSRPPNLSRWISEPGYDPFTGGTYLSKFGNFDMGLLHEWMHYAAWLPDKYYQDTTEYNTEVGAIGFDGNPIPADEFYSVCEEHNGNNMMCSGSQLNKFDADWIRFMEKKGFTSFSEVAEYWMTDLYDDLIGDTPIPVGQNAIGRVFVGKVTGYEAWTPHFLFEDHPDIVLEADANGNLILPKELVGGYGYRTTDESCGVEYPVAVGKSVLVEVVNPDGTVRYENFSTFDFIDFSLGTQNQSTSN